MALDPGDLVAGDEILIKAGKRHVYIYPDPQDGTRRCEFCGLSQTKPWKNVSQEVPCPGR